MICVNSVGNTPQLHVFLFMYLDSQQVFNIINKKRFCYINRCVCMLVLTMLCCSDKSAVLQAHRLTALEKLVKKLTQQPQGIVHMAGAPGGKSPDERLLRRLGSDLAIVKKRLDEIAPPKDPGALMMMREGDHAMLAGKPLQGYRQACFCGSYAMGFRHAVQTVASIRNFMRSSVNEF